MNSTQSPLERITTSIIGVVLVITGSLIIIFSAVMTLILHSIVYMSLGIGRGWKKIKKTIYK